MSRLQKHFPECGAPNFRGPVRLNSLNTPKSSPGRVHNSKHFYVLKNVMVQSVERVQNDPRTQIQMRSSPKFNYFFFSRIKSRPFHHFRCFEAGKITVGLASNWPCVTDSTVYPPIRTRWPRKERWAPRPTFQWSMAPLLLPIQVRYRKGPLSQRSAHSEQYAQTKTNTNPSPDPNRYRRRCPDRNARIQKFLHYMAIAAICDSGPLR